MESMTDSDANEESSFLRDVENGFVGDPTKLLLARNPSLVALRDGEGNTPLHLACGVRRSVEMVCILLQHGADVNAVNAANKTSLHIAAEESCDSVVDELIDAGAKVALRDNAGNLPIFYAALSGDRAMIMALDLAHSPNDLPTAAAMGRTELLKGALADEIASGRDVERALGTALRAASSRGHATVVESLLACGALPNMPDATGWTSLHSAVAIGNSEIVKALLSYGANANAVNATGRTPLQIATENDRNDIAESLLAAGATMDVCLAAMLGRAKAVAKYLEESPELVAKRDNGFWRETPLAYAAIHGRRDVAVLLLKHGAEMDFRDDGGNTPLIWAARNGHEDVVKLLLEHHADVNAVATIQATIQLDSPIHAAAANGHASVVAILAEAGADVNKMRGPFNATPLYYAASGGHSDVAKLLLDFGAEVDLVETTGIATGATPLLMAVESSRYDVGRLLLRHGANPNIQDRFGNSAISVATKLGNEEFIRLLLERD